VTSKAEKKSQDLIFRALRENPQAKIIFTGCVAQDNYAFRMPDNRVIVVKNDFKSKIPEILNGFLPAQLDSAKEKFNFCISDFKGHNRAFIKIQDGCENHCAYCKIPLVRGRPQSREKSKIIDEARRLINRGFKEIVLTGICLGSYGKDLVQNIMLTDIIEELISLKGDFRVRLSSIEAKDVTDRLVDLLASSSRLCRHLHIPFQSGDNEILRKMNRNYTRADYLELVDKLRRNIPQVAITTDIMVGFPSETDDNFNNTYSFLKKAAPSRVHIFPFSPREGTAAYNFRERVAAHKVRERLLRLRELVKEISFEYRYNFLYKKLSVLVETQRSRFQNYLRGYSDNYINIFVKGNDDLCNNLVEVVIKEVKPEFTLAEPV
jgi:threonylcarbamoyladenosine tRNA methylthiotransferase MtaB